MQVKFICMHTLTKYHIVNVVYIMIYLISQQRAGNSPSIDLYFLFFVKKITEFIKLLLISTKATSQPCHHASIYRHINPSQ